MGLINQNTDNAVKALLFIASHEEDRLSVMDLAEELDIPYPFLRKILQTLRQKGIVNSFKGRGGGFELSLPLREIFLLDLILIFQGSVTLTNCGRNGSRCLSLPTCPLRKKMSAVQRRLIEELESISLAALLEENVSAKSGVSSADN